MFLLLTIYVYAVLSFVAMLLLDGRSVHRMLYPLVFGGAILLICLVVAGRVIISPGAEDLPMDVDPKLKP